jgi:hypothetical protein
MPRFLCSHCHEVSEMSGVGRFDWCPACAEPLTAEDRLPVHFGISTGAVAERAAPALATTTNPNAASSRAPSISPSTT